MVFDFINNLINETLTDTRSSNNNNFELIEAGKVHDENTGGILNERYSLHIIPIEGDDDDNNKLFMNRISYNTQNNAYYENGILSNKYLKKWGEGTYINDNIKLKIEYDWKQIYLARLPEKQDEDGEISWKFDYRVGGYIINSLNLKLSFDKFDNTAGIHWFIKPLPTMKNPEPAWKLIRFDQFEQQQNQSEQHVNEIKNVTQFVRDEYGFILKARLSGGEDSKVKWQKTQLFRQNWSVLDKDLDDENDETFPFDVKVELKPDIIIDPLPKLSKLELNDESTSDLIIRYEISGGGGDGNNDDNEYDNCDDDQGNSVSNKEIKTFHVHTQVLSDYFKELLDTRIIESVESVESTESQESQESQESRRNKTLTLTDDDIPYGSLEIILRYLYTGTLPDIESYDESITLLRYASKFSITTLIQRCEKTLKGHLNHDNLNDIETIADTYGAEQLLQYCKSFEPPVSQELIEN